MYIRIFIPSIQAKVRICPYSYTNVTHPLCSWEGRNCTNCFHFACFANCGAWQRGVGEIIKGNYYEECFESAGRGRNRISRSFYHLVKTRCLVLVLNGGQRRSRRGWGYRFERPQASDYGQRARGVWFPHVHE